MLDEKDGSFLLFFLGVVVRYETRQDEAAAEIPVVKYRVMAVRSRSRIPVIWSLAAPTRARMQGALLNRKEQRARNCVSHEADAGDDRNPSAYRRSSIRLANTGGKGRKAECQRATGA